MIQTLQTRLLLWKRQLLSLLFWLIFPIIATIFITLQMSVIQDDAQIPIGIVLDDKSDMAEELLKDIEDTPHIRPVLVTEREGIQQLTTHELDSLFIIRENYMENINRGRRNQLITTYQTNLSFAYAPVRETIISFVQRDFVRAETVETIQQMKEVYSIIDEWPADEIMDRGKMIETEQALLTSDFAFVTDEFKTSNSDKYLIEPWGLWALLTILATLMLFDWVIKENRSLTIRRLTFSRLRIKTYFWHNFFLYTCLLLAFDLLTLITFTAVLKESITVTFIVALLVYRLTINIVIFLFGLPFRSLYGYYASGFLMTLIVALFSGVVIPIKDVFLKYIHPVIAFQNNQLFSGLLFVGLVILIGWLLRKDDHYA